MEKVEDEWKSGCARLAADGASTARSKNAEAREPGAEQRAAQRALCEKSVSPGTKLTRSVREYTWPQKSTVFAILVAYDTWDAAQAHRYHHRAHYAHGKVASEEQLRSQQPIRPVHEATTRLRARAVWHADVYQPCRSDARIALASQPYWLFCQMATRQEDVLRLRLSLIHI